MNLETSIKEYLFKSLEFNEWIKDGLKINDVAWLIEDYIIKTMIIGRHEEYKRGIEDVGIIA